MKETPQKLTVRLSTGTMIRAVLVIAFCAMLFYIKDIILVILAAIVIASSIEPLTLWCESKRIHRVPAVIMIYALLGFLLVIFLFFFLPNLLNEAILYVDKLPNSIHLGDIWKPIEHLDSLADTSVSIDQVLDVAKESVAGAEKGTFQTVSTVFGGLFSFILMFVLSFYLSVQTGGVRSFLKLISPLKHHDYIVDLWQRSKTKIGYWMQGQLILALIVGTLVYVSLLLLDVDHPLLLASIAAIFELVPIFGPIFAAIPAILIASGSGGASLGVLVALLYIVIQQIESNILYPMVVKKIVGISPIIVILALVIGGKLGGFLGALLSVPLASALMEFIDDFEKGRKKYPESIY
ncbi:MAG: AI-2E family transporter [Patescibacteria group bacterium]